MCQHQELHFCNTNRFSRHGGVVCGQSSKCIEKPQFLLSFLDVTKVNLKKCYVMKTTICKTFTAKATIGLFKGYSRELTSIEVFKEVLLEAQQKIKAEYDIALSAKLIPCEILFLGQDELSMELQFIQYPKFPIEESKLKKAILELTKLLMIKLEQNRVVIVFTDEIVMLEQSSEIDPNIKI